MNGKRRRSQRRVVGGGSEGTHRLAGRAARNSRSLVGPVGAALAPWSAPARGSPPASAAEAPREQALGARKRPKRRRAALSDGPSNYSAATYSPRPARAKYHRR